MKKGVKNAEFHADFESVVKKCTKKVISKTNLTNMSKREKSAFFRLVFANNFFLCIFSKLFQRIRGCEDALGSINVSRDSVNCPIASGNAVGCRCYTLSRYDVGCNNF
jgi:hypothetical protein